MPYKSDAQRRFFHTDTARKAGISPAMTSEWDNASRGLKLPSHAEHETVAKAVKKKATDMKSKGETYGSSNNGRAKGYS